jgi:outer membrane protein assembly factor BamA
VRPALIILALLAAPAAVVAQEPQTRADLLRQQREAKSRGLEPAEAGGAERLLMTLENGRLFERLLNPAEGLYPKLGNITAGSGFSLGPAYRHPGLLGGRATASAFAAASFSRYWMLEGRLQAPRLAGDRLLVDVHAQRYDFPEEEFFGIGPRSRRADAVTYGLRNTVLGASAAYAPAAWLSITGTIDRLAPSITAGDEDDPIASLFTDADAPGLDVQPAFVHVEAAADVNTREPRGNPRRGGRYLLRYHGYDDLDDGAYSFDRVDADLQQYLPFLNDRRVIALRALASVSGARDGARIPFYLQPTLGGPDDLRGFRRFRFRDAHALLLQIEYRWEIFTAVDGALFYDAGKVASRIEDVDFRDLESDYGIGFRFGTSNGVFLRVEGAFGSSGGAHFVMRFGHVF